jgi:ribonuclease HII
MKAQTEKLFQTLDASDGFSHVETLLRGQGFNFIVGVDEAGRGALAGPVVAAAVFLPVEHRISGLNDSKKLSPARRAELYEAITNGTTLYGVGVVSSRVVDRVNVRVAALNAMAKAVERLPGIPDYVLIDGRDTIPCDVVQRAVVGGDARVYSIAAASIVAKHYRDTLMKSADKRYPGYGFAEHKGYGTAAHLASLRTRGVCPLHRVTFGPCREVIFR